MDEEKAAEKDNDDSDVGLSGWCASKHMVVISVICSVLVYVIGAIISGITYRVYGLSVPSTCTLPDGRFMPTSMVIYPTPLVVVGPCFMSAGGAILIFLMFQWCFCRPLTRM
ncbi:hypothetical protein Pcinc_020299 [Petrolisthes cinctipes]|uniref:Transmembrane protein n=1 Tax=Petrolisthes cinctipes TaxID=88211 RepID=A0AAE1FJF0_PETCI|nr:hypothetical protein Pcinc_020299 [Petrolisthes cinctipes]